MPCFCAFGSSLFSFFFSISLHLSFILSVPDIDECGAVAQPCSSGFNCVNTVGSYMCQRRLICSRGYHASPDGSRCIGKICSCYTWRSDLIYKLKDIVSRGCDACRKERLHNGTEFQTWRYFAHVPVKNQKIMNYTHNRCYLSYLQTPFAAECYDCHFMNSFISSPFLRVL